VCAQVALSHTLKIRLHSYFLVALIGVFGVVGEWNGCLPIAGIDHCYLHAAHTLPRRLNQLEPLPANPFDYNNADLIISANSFRDSYLIASRSRAKFQNTLAQRQQKPRTDSRDIENNRYSRRAQKNVAVCVISFWRLRI